MKKYIVINKNEELEFTGKNTPYPIEQALSLYDGLGGNYHGFSVVRAAEKPAIKSLGFKKIIIEEFENSAIYGILCINENDKTAVLDYFDRGEKIENLDHEGTMMCCVSLSAIAREKCKEIRVNLITY